MTDQEYKSQKKRIQILIDKWISPLGLRWWRIRFNYFREDRKNGETSYRPLIGEDGDWKVMFATTCDPYYLTASIDCYLPTILEADNDEVEECFLHELMHVILSPMHHKATRKEEELVATNLARAFGYLEEKK